MPTSKEATRWRATGSYVPTLSSKTSLLEKTRQFLLTYARLGDLTVGQPHLTLTVHPMTTNVVVHQSQLTVTHGSMPPQIVDSTIPDSTTTLVA